MQRRRPSMVMALAAVIGLSGVFAGPAAAAEDAVYYLPVAEGSSLTVQQGNNRPAGRTADERYAFDFVATDPPERFEVVAARGGTVISARTGVAAGKCAEPLDGPRPSCWRTVNYVLIDHGDGTSGLYLNLKRGDAPFRIGDVVSAGQPIGTAGRSGWTDKVGLGFQVQGTPTWDVRGKGGWFLTPSLPVSFSDPEVLAVRANGIPRTGDTVTSGNPEASFSPFRFHTRPVGLPASVPFETGIEREITDAYDPASPDGYGLHFDAAPGQPPATVRPLFGGELEFAGCATGDSAALGRTVAIRFDLEGTPYLAIHGHLLGIDSSLLGLDPELPNPIIGPADPIGRSGAFELGDTDSAQACVGADLDQKDLFVTILRDGVISPEGEITAGTPVSPEPLVGELGYEGLAWWSGPVAAADVTSEPGRPRARWNSKTPASGSHIKAGRTVTLKARVRDVSDIAQVRFRAWYPSWPVGAPSRKLHSFDPDESWRELALCDAPGTSSGVANLCQWQGDATDGRVTYVWDPGVARAQLSAPWLPRAKAATSSQRNTCVPVSLAVDVIDKSGHVYSDILNMPRPGRCDDTAAEARDGARVLYLDPLVPPAGPSSRGAVADRGWPPVYGPDPLDGAIVWRDRSGNEDGFRIYARRHWFTADCSVAKGPWYSVATVATNKERYRPGHKKVQDLLPIPAEAYEAPGYLSYWEYAVAAYNAAGETAKTRVGGFVGGSEAFCDLGGLVPPDELEP